MNDQPIHLPRTLVNQLLHLAQLSPDRGIAALVGARVGIPKTSYPVNQAESSAGETRAFDPQDLDAALAAIRSNGETLFAVFVSHPSMPAVPTAGEIASRTCDGVPRLIASLNTRGVLEIRGYQIGPRQTVTEVALEMVE